jgi:hypothetical protein
MKRQTMMLSLSSSMHLKHGNNPSAPVTTSARHPLLAGIFLALAAALPLADALAASRTVSDGDTPTENGATYDHGGANTHALTVTGPDSSYSGTNITLSIAAPASAKVAAAISNGGTMLLQTGTITIDGNNTGISITDAESCFKGNNLTIIGTGTQVSRYALESFAGGQLELESSTIDTVKQGVVANGGTMILRDVDLSSWNRGYVVVSGGRMEVTGGSLHMNTGASQTQGFYSSGSTSYLVIKNVTASITTPDALVCGIVLLNDGHMDIKNTTLDVTGLRGETYAGSIRDGTFEATDLTLTSNDSGMILRGNLDATFTDSRIISETNTLLIQDDNLSAGIDRTIKINDGSLTARHGPLIVTRGDEQGRSADITINGTTLAGDTLLLSDKNVNLNLTLNNADTTAAGGINLGANSAGEYDITLNGGTGLNGDVTSTGAATLALTLNDSTLTGTVNSGGNQGADIDLVIDGSTWTSTGASVLGDLTLNGATLHLTLNNLADAITVTGALDVVTGGGEGGKGVASKVFVDLGNDLLAQIAAGLAGEEGTGTAVIDVFDLITGSETFVGDGLEYVLSDHNAAGSTYTVTYLQGGEYRIGDIVLAAVPESAAWATLAGLTLLAWVAMRRSRNRRRHLA